MTLYKDFTSVEALNDQYLPGSSNGGLGEIVAGWMSRSATVRTELDGRYDVRFGPTVDEYLDIFPSGTPNSPVVMFIHAGYWHRFSTKDFSFIAKPLVESGITVILNNYALCPAVTIDEIVRQCRAAMAWLVEHVASHDGDPTNISVAGHSAGGHLAAVLGSGDWQEAFGLNAAPIRGIAALSGLYDLRPFPFTSLQPMLQFTGDQILRNSPIFFAERCRTSTALFVGERESAEFQRQATSFHDALQRDSGDAAVHVVPDQDHFTILEGFADPASALSGYMRKLCFS